MTKNEASHQQTEAASLPVSELGAVDSVCDRFELAWQFGERPSITKYLNEIKLALRGNCFRHLLEMDLEYRRQKAEVVRRQDYLPEFREYEETIDDVFGELNTVDRDTTSAQEPSQPSNSDAAILEPTARIGRFRLVETIAEGGFGTVYLGYDEDLNRRVAIKVARQGRPTGHADLQILEARVAASLDHPGIVPVYEVCRLPSGRLFIVSKLIDGTDLKARLTEFSYSPQEAARLIATVADALHAAHQKGIIHRDVKPANILIDGELRPYLTDFGLALREEETGLGAHFVGTVKYMSPEQAREEGHLVDARSDVFSLCIVLYEMVTGQAPFIAATRDELLEAIRKAAPTRPSRLNETVDTELERIILKGLSRRAGDRHQSAKDLADELRDWQEAVSRGLTLSDKGAAPFLKPVAQEADVLVVPKGLRSFDENDHDFFCRLLPGPRTRQGIPESIAFWKSKVESRVSDSAFRVGVIYGPIGSGKSSFVHAGLMPLLDSTILACRVVATPDVTEQAWLRELRRIVPGISRVTDLPQAMRELRSGDRISRDTKVLVVIDQFEQWLSGQSELASSDVVAALRQCDGVHIQTLLLVRDDYWYPLARCLKHVEIELDSHNCRMTDAFDEEHARRVLLEFGRSFNRALPDTPGESEGAVLFAQAAVGELAAGGRIIPVQLALFADMFRHRPWSRRELARLGGVNGVVSMFLDNVVAGDTAHPVLRQHQESVVRLMRTLLPPSGSTLKDRPRKLADLVAGDGDGDTATSSEILNVLEAEHRLVAAQYPDGDETGEEHFQLSHDYLVPIVREWVSRRQRDSFHGRAQNLLEDRTVMWSTDPSRRHLPSAPEWLSILFLTRHAHWTAAARRMMAKANRWYLSCLLGVVLVGSLIAWGVNRNANRRYAQALVRQLVGADTAELSEIVDEIKAGPTVTENFLKEQLANANSAEDSDERGFRRQLHVAAALTSHDPSHLDFLLTAGLQRVEPREVESLAKVLEDDQAKVVGPLWTQLRSSEKESQEHVLRIACALAYLDPENDRWNEHLEEITTALLSARSLHLKAWMDQLVPIADRIRPILSRQFENDLPDESQSRALAEVYASYAADDAGALVTAIVQAGPNQLEPLLASLARHSHEAIRIVDAKLASLTTGDQSIAGVPPPTQACNDLIKRYQGHVGETAAFVQSLPEAEIEETVKAMELADFRPVSFRPFYRKDELFAALGWKRDGRIGRISLDLTRPEVLEQAQSPTERLVDLSSYGTGSSARFAATWLDDGGNRPTCKLYVDEHFPAQEELTNRYKLGQFYPRRLLLREGESGEPLFSAVWCQNSQATGDTAPKQVRLADSFENSYLGYLQTDCQFYFLDVNRSDRYHAYRLVHRGLDPSRRTDTDIESLAVAHLQIGQIDTLLAILGNLIDETPKHEFWHQLRARTLCASRNVAGAEDELKELERLEASADVLELVRVRLAVLRQQWEQAIEHLRDLEDLVQQQSDNVQLIAKVVRANSILASGLQQEDPEEARRLQNRACELLRRPGLSWKKTTLMRDPDLDALRSHPSFQAFLNDKRWGVRYTGIWSDSYDTQSELAFGLSPPDHAERCLEFMQQGYYPRCLAVRNSPMDGQLIACSVWHRRFVPPEEELQLSDKLANLAIAAAAIGEFLPLAEALADEDGRQTRAYVVDRLPKSGIPAEQIANLRTKRSNEFRRNVWLALGAYGTDAHRAIPMVLESGDDEDPAHVRSAKQWCWRQVGVAGTSSRQKTSANSGNRGNDWYINSIGQTMIEIDAPSEIVMGSPAWELQHASNEVQQFRSIGGSFAISSTETTVRQFREFLTDPDVASFYAERDAFTYSQEYTRSVDCPQISVTYYDAIRFCQWLSRKEGISDKEHCFRKKLVEDGDAALDEYLQRTGYRLPTEAEWEYACRAGSESSHHFGPAKDVLSSYAWHIFNANDQTHPVRELIPNEFGLFDMLGNAGEWCQDAYRNFNHPENAERDRQLSDRILRPLRGGSFQSSSAGLRSATRSAQKPGAKSYKLGFRVARTVRRKRQ